MSVLKSDGYVHQCNTLSNLGIIEEQDQIWKFHIMTLSEYVDKDDDTILGLKDLIWITAVKDGGASATPEVPEGIIYVCVCI
jgi:hypothetical protein